MSKHTTMNEEFYELNSEQISQLAKDYLTEKEELEKSRRQISFFKLVSLGGISLALAPLGPVVTAIALISGLPLVTGDTEVLAERLNELKKKRVKETN